MSHVPAPPGGPTREALSADPAAAFFPRREPFVNGHLLWSPQQLQARLGDPKLALLDLRGSHELAQGVIPGAAHLDIYGLGLTSTQPPLWEELVHLMRSLLALRGVSMDKTVVFYEDGTGMLAGRAFWLLEYFGHQDVHVLDGGFRAWRAAGLPLAQGAAQPHPASLKITPQRHLYIGADELRDKLAAGEVVTLDVRDDDEYTGARKRAARGGTIPGSLHVAYARYVDEQGRFLPPSQLEALLRSAGINREKPIVPF